MSVYLRETGTYSYDFQMRGVRFFGTTGCTRKRDAEEFEANRREQAKEELKARDAGRSAPLTMNAALDRLWLEVGQHYTGTYRKTVFTALAWMLKEFGPDTLITDITSSRIAEAIARRRGEGVKATKAGKTRIVRPVTNSTVNRTVTELLRLLFKRVADVWEQPTPKIAWKDLMLPEPKERIRELRDNEESKLVGNMRNDYLPALAFFVVSGCRLHEVVHLKKTMFDWTAMTILIHGKGDKAETIPLTEELVAIVTPLWDDHPEYVFTYVSQRSRQHPVTGKTIPRGQRYPITYEGMKTTWRRYGGKSAGLTDFRLHDTRHTAATRLLRETGNLRIVQQLLRHEDIATTAKYAHANIDDVRAGMERVTESRRKSRMAGTAEPQSRMKSKG